MGGEFLRYGSGEACMRYVVILKVWQCQIVFQEFGVSAVEQEVFYERMEMFFL